MPVLSTSDVPSGMISCIGLPFRNMCVIKYSISRLPSSFFSKERGAEMGKVCPRKSVGIKDILFSDMCYCYETFLFDKNFQFSEYAGLLIMALESYFRGDVPDIQICTMSISYERTLEENLYAYEILGIPKPRESTSVRFHFVFSCEVGQS